MIRSGLKCLNGLMKKKCITEASYGVVNIETVIEQLKYALQLKKSYTKK